MSLCQKTNKFILASFSPPYENGQEKLLLTISFCYTKKYLAFGRAFFCINSCNYDYNSYICIIKQYIYMKTNIVLSSPDRVLFGVQVRQETQTNFLNLSDLQDAYDSIRVKEGWSDKRIDHVTQTASFKEHILNMIGNKIIANSDFIDIDKVNLSKLIKENGITCALKGIKAWKTTGARQTKTTWANPYIWFLIAKGIFPFKAHEQIDSFFKELGYTFFEVEYIRHEVQFFIELTKATEGIVEWERQYPVDQYRIDFYSKKYNLAVEYDECHHKYKEEYDNKRQNYIQQKMPNIVFVRVKKGYESEGLNNILKHILYAKQYV